MGLGLGVVVGIALQSSREQHSSLSVQDTPEPLGQLTHSHVCMSRYCTEVHRYFAQPTHVEDFPLKIAQTALESHVPFSRPSGHCLADSTLVGVVREMQNRMRSEYLAHMSMWSDLRDVCIWEG